MSDFFYIQLTKNRIPILKELPKYIIQYLVTVWGKQINFQIL